jgi:hypothetical protein
MATARTNATERYIYRASNRSLAERTHVSAYLVERHHGSIVVARIEPLGLVRATTFEHEIALEGLRRNLVSVGKWHVTPSATHARIRVRQLEKS